MRGATVGLLDCRRRLPLDRGATTAANSMSVAPVGETAGSTGSVNRKTAASKPSRYRLRNRLRREDNKLMRCLADDLFQSVQHRVARWLFLGTTKTNLVYRRRGREVQNGE